MYVKLTNNVAENYMFLYYTYFTAYFGLSVNQTVAANYLYICVVYIYHMCGTNKISVILVFNMTIIVNLVEISRHLSIDTFLSVFPIRNSFWFGNDDRICFVLSVPLIIILRGYFTH